MYIFNRYHRLAKRLIKEETLPFLIKHINLNILCIYYGINSRIDDINISDVHILIIFFRCLFTGSMIEFDHNKRRYALRSNGGVNDYYTRRKLLRLLTVLIKYNYIHFTIIYQDILKDVHDDKERKSKNRKDNDLYVRTILKDLTTL